MTQVFFGGPDQPAGLLRDLLARHADAVPQGGEILWSTYYFRDLGLAEALIRARRRGVTVRLCLEASPKLATANKAVAERLASPDGLAPGGLRLIKHLLPAHLHEKIYFFSHPTPVALVGSFNPSGNTPENPQVLAKIGDQDRGHNCLVALDEAAAVASLRRHVLSLHSGGGGLASYFNRPARSDFGSDRLNISHYPRWDSDVVARLIGARKYDSIRIAASHFRDMSIARLLARHAQAGTPVTVIAHDTLRRVPRRIEDFARMRGLTFLRYAHPESLPMHAKFILLAAEGFRRVLFGSMNLTLTSRFLNNEVLVALDQAPDIFDAFDARFAHMLAEIRQFQTPSEG